MKLGYKLQPRTIVLSLSFVLMALLFAAFVWRASQMLEAPVHVFSNPSFTVTKTDVNHRVEVAHEATLGDARGIPHLSSGAVTDVTSVNTNTLDAKTTSVVANDALVFDSVITNTNETFAPPFATMEAPEIANATNIVPNTVLIPPPLGISETDINENTVHNIVTLLQTDLMMTKSDSVDPVNVGMGFSYALIVTNIGPDVATNVIVTDTLPAEVGFIGVSGTGWSCGASLGVVTCTRLLLGVGAAPAITINVTAPTVSTTLTNTASVSAAESDLIPGNNSDSEATTIRDTADLLLTKADSFEPIPPGTPLTYTLSITNAGLSNATGVLVTDTLPAEVSWNGDTCTVGPPTGQMWVWNVGALANGVSARCEVYVTVNSAGNGVITNTAVISSDVFDPKLVNNTAIEPTSINTPPTLSNITVSTPINENEMATLTGNITDPDASDSFTLVVDWGDGSAVQTFNYLAGTTVFTETHPYLDDAPSGTASDNFSIGLTLTDSGNNSVSGAANVTVNNVAPILSNLFTAASTSEGELVTLSGDISDAGTLDSFTLDVDWGDGTATDTFTYTAGTTAFSVSHKYVDDNPSGTSVDSYTVGLTLTDDDTASVTENASIDVKNISPALVGISANAINENGATTLTGAIDDPGVEDTFTLLVNWGDGTPSEIFDYVAGTTTFTETHQYLDDNPSGTPSDNYTINLSLTDDDIGTATDSTLITVNNVAPTLAALSTVPVNENGTTTLTGIITDPGTVDTFTLSVNWGDGSALGIFHYPVGTTFFTETHQYLDDNPSVTPADLYTIGLSLADDDTGTITDTITVTVTNAAPTLSGLSITNPVNEGQTATLTGSLADVGTLDTFRLTVDWGDGSALGIYNYPVGTAFFTETHLYADDNPPGTPFDLITVTLNLADDDFGVVTDTVGLTVFNVAPILSNVSATPVNENAATTLTGNISDAGTGDTFVLVVDWGDGSTPQTFNYGVGTTSFSVTHLYPDDAPTGTPADNYLISLTLTDHDLGTDTDSTTVMVSNIAPTLSALSATPINENGTTTLTGTIIDPSPLDSFTLVVDWGDGSDPETLNFIAGTTTFTTTHPYLDDNPSGTPSDSYPIGLTVTDDDTGSSSQSTNVTVSNVSPALSNLAITSSTEEGRAVMLTGVLSDTGTLDSFTLVVDWGDGLPVEAFTYPAGTSTISETHVYADDNPTGTPSDPVSVQLTLTDDDTGSTTASTTLTVTNVAPTLSNVVLPSLLNEGDTATLTGNITDPGIGDTFTLLVDWGDGSTPETFNFPAGTTVFTETHLYTDDNPSGTPSDTYTVTLTLADDDTGRDTATVQITVNNVVPILSATYATADIPENSLFIITGHITDPGADSFIFAVNWGDGSVVTYTYPVGTSTYTVTHLYVDDNPSGTPSDPYFLSFFLADDDTGSITVALPQPITVLNVAPTFANLTATFVNENGTTTLTGTLVDPSPLDTFAMEIAWGDGSVLTYTLPAGTTLFTETHRYLDDDPTGTPADTYTLTLTVTDDDTGIGTGTTSLLVSNLAPILSQLAITPANENSLTTLTGLFTDTGTLDTYSLSIAWGDGLTETFSYTTTGAFTQTHIYLDGVLTPVTTQYTATLTLTDDDTGQDTAFLIVSVENIAPVITSLSALSPIDENGTTILSGTFFDPGTLDTFTLFVDWGDGRVLTATYPAGSFDFLHTHQYLDDDPTATPSDTYTLTVTLTDNDGGADTDETALTVNNLPPTVFAGPDQAIAVPLPVTFSGVFTDVGTLDTHTILWNFGDGLTATGTLTPTHTFPGVGTYSVTLTVTDDDTGMGTDTLFVTILPVADLALTQQVTPGPILSGSSVVYTLTVNNLGPSFANSVTLTDTLPEGVSFASSSGACSVEGGLVTCALGSLANGVSTSVQLTTTVSTMAGGLLSNTAQVRSADADPNLDNNTASVTVEVIPSLIVFEDDFEDQLQPEWGCATPHVSTTPFGGRHFLGEFAAEEVCLNLMHLPQHAYVRVTFDLFIIRSWDGTFTEMPPNLQAYALEETVGPDIWKFQADGTDLLSTTFANWPDFRQSYPGNYPTSDYRALTGAVEVQTLGYEFWGIPEDAVYHPVFTFAHAGDTLDLTFISQQLQDIFDESWGLDNVVVMISMTNSFGVHVIYLPLTAR